jgi:uncharacterized protein
MRIQDNRPAMPMQQKTGTESANSSAAGGIPFREMMDQHTAQPSPSERINQLLDEIGLAGERLAKTLTVRELVDYKSLVKSFLEEAVKNGVGMDQREGASRRGRPKIHKMITETNNKLVELTNLVLDKEQKGIDILGKVGEIKGLLINMYL